VISFKSIYQLSFNMIVLIVFMIGGAFQFFIGIPNTLLTLGLCALMLFNYIVYSFLRKRVVFNKVVMWSGLYVLTILVSALVNRSDLFSTLIYFIFPILPLSAYLFFRVNIIEGYIKWPYILKIIVIIGLIQLPILLIQRNFYDFFIGFNNSSQNIASFDFLFGTFFLKSDHSLGFFIICSLIVLLFNIHNSQKIVSHPLLLSLYLSLSLLLSESNISKGLMVFIWAVFIIKLIFKSSTNVKIIKRLLILPTAVLLVVTAYNFRNIEFITSKVGGTIEKHYTPDRSLRFFRDGTAKREQILIAAATKLDPKYTGDGPYSYFDMRTGQFKNTIHFSQIIWTYFDLGLVGLVVVFFYVLNLIKSTARPYDSKLFLGVLCFFGVYMLYTTPFSEIGIISSLFLFFNSYNSK